MPEDFVVARNPDPDSTLPYLVRLPLGPEGIVLKARDTWPRTAKIYCHRAAEWPPDPQVVERVAVRSCVRRGAAIDLVLDRGRENRSQFVLTRIRGGREAIFWQSARTAKQARPNVGAPRGRAQGIGELEVLVDIRERYPYRFARRGAVRMVRRPLAAGDYAVELAGRVVAGVERKSLADLSASLMSGRLRYALAELASLPRAAVVVEDRYSSVFKLEHVQPSAVADALAEAQVRYPGVPVVFCETRPLAEDWTYRFLAAALVELDKEAAAAQVELPAAGPLAPAAPTTAEVRAWAVAQGLSVSDRGRLRPEVWAAFASRGGSDTRPGGTLR
ncbi:MAG TPA: ERCC4 domain-containing protein [Jiangellales bacterium]|nr:ERCC4 domain-containing protein [Jiangellales bacterium]